MTAGKHIELYFRAPVHSLLSRLRHDSLLRNSIYIMGSTVVTSVIGYLYWIVAAHIYSAQDVGLASALVAAMTLTSTLANLGIGSALVQVLPHREAGYAWSLTLNAGLAMGTLMSLLAGIIVPVILALFSPPFSVLMHQTSYMLVFIAGVPLWTIGTLLDQAFIAERAVSNVLLRNAMFAMLKLFLMVLLVYTGALGIFSSSVLAFTLASVGGGLLLLPRLRRHYCLVTYGITRYVRTMLVSFAGHHFINIGGLAPMYLLPVFVTIRLSTAANAYFYSAWMLGSIFFMVSPAVATSLFAEGSYAPNAILRKATSSIVIISTLLGPAMVVTFLAGHSILSFFGPGYVQYGLQLLMVLTAAAVPDAITNVYVSVLRVQKRLRYAALLNLGMALITLTLAWMLLPLLGIAGVGWAFLVAQITGSVVAAIEITYSRSRWRYCDEITVKLAIPIVEMKGHQEGKKIVPRKFPKKVVLYSHPEHEIS